MECKKTYFLGIDVGTGSVRAAVFDDVGTLLSVSVEEILIWNTRPDHYEQSSNNIWISVVKAVKNTITDSKVDPADITGIGFDATCSLVVLDQNYEPLSVSLDGDSERNIIMWMDHRAAEEANEINLTFHSVLDTMGGTMSLEMQPPKLKWLKKNLPNTWEIASHFMDLPDFLTGKATGSLSRSVCSLGCKWSYQAQDAAWNDEFLILIGLGDLTTDGYARIGEDVQNIGLPCGAGLSIKAAEEFGLRPGTPVGTSMIDAHAGALGCLSCSPDLNGANPPDMESSLVLIAGTSTCHILCSKSMIKVPGVWGPYYSAMVPHMWVNEGGQSSAGSLIDFVTFNHPAINCVKELANERNIHVYEYLNDLLDKITVRDNYHAVAELTQSFHVWPDFHGNRSPIADPSLRGMVCGLSLSTNEENLALYYLATIQSLAYGTKHIISEMEAAGHSISNIYLCGGLRKNKVFVETHTDVLGLPLVLPDIEESVLLGSAVLAMCASRVAPDIRTAMTRLGGKGRIIEPNELTRSYHTRKYSVFQEMLQDQRKYEMIMKGKTCDFTADH